MKKVIFRMQMFALIAMFPAYLVAELTKANKNLPVVHSTPVSAEKFENSNTQSVNFIVDDDWSILMHK